MPLEHAARFVAELARTRDAHDLAGLVGRELSELGYPAFSLAVVSSKSDNWIQRPSLSNFDQDVQGRYINAEWIGRDPTLARIRAGDDLVAWTVREYARDKSLEEYSRFVASLGFGGGVTVALVRVAGRICVINAVRPGDGEHDPLVSRAIALVGNALVLHEWRKLSLDTDLGRMARLSPRQIEVLSWAVDGKSNGVIAEILGISAATVAYHMSTVIRELEVATRSQAIAWFVANRGHGS